MKFFRNNWYWVLGIVIGLGIGSIIVMHRVQQQTSEPEQRMPEVAEHTPDAAKPQISAAPDSTAHRTPNNDVPRKRRPVRINTDARKNPALTGSIHFDHNHPEPTPPLPADALQRRNTMLRKLADANKLYEEFEDGTHKLTSEAEQTELKALTGGMTPEEAIAFLEEHDYYNEAILGQVSAHRAFKYLQAIRASGEKINEYAAKALAENPDNFEAKMKLILSEKDNAKAAAGYREILAKDPNHVGALLNLGGRIHFDDPEGALVHFTKANKLDPTHGLSGIGRVYERLGDLKTAWLYYRKHLTIWPRDLLAGSHLSWIEAGQPKYTPIHLERQTVPPRDEAVMDKDAVIPKEKRPPAAKKTPWLPELSPRETHPQENQPIDAEAARAEFQRLQQAAVQKEFDAFIKWAERIMHEDSVRGTEDFLAQELRTHLKGGKAAVSPERLVRAFELMERHGRTNGLERLKDKDPELAVEVERFLEEKRQPPRRSNQQNKNK